MLLEKFHTFQLFWSLLEPTSFRYSIMAAKANSWTAS